MVAAKNVRECLFVCGKRVIRPIIWLICLVSAARRSTG